MGFHSTVVFVCFVVLGGRGFCFFFLFFLHLEHKNMTFLACSSLKSGLTFAQYVAGFLVERSTSQLANGSVFIQCEVKASQIPPPSKAVRVLISFAMRCENTFSV